MDKYIIKNCPAILKCKYGNYCIEPENTEYTKQLCKDFTDCLLKQIVEKCKEPVKNCNTEVQTKEDVERFLGKNEMAQSILDLLDISDVLGAEE